MSETAVIKKKKGNRAIWSAQRRQGETHSLPHADPPDGQHACLRRERGREKERATDRHTTSWLAVPPNSNTNTRCICSQQKKTKNPLHTRQESTAKARQSQQTHNSGNDYFYLLKSMGYIRKHGQVGAHLVSTLSFFVDGSSWKHAAVQVASTHKATLSAKATKRCCSFTREFKTSSPHTISHKRAPTFPLHSSLSPRMNVFQVLFFLLSLAPFTCIQQQQPPLCQSWQSQLKWARLHWRLSANRFPGLLLLENGQPIAVLLRTAVWFRVVVMDGRTFSFKI